ncbi:protein ECT2-like [Clytia hemisphaerica]|uniref:Protein ECT2 n=1 Tax=Clytia hemisphaerica TaxID=252671 RepID=A0A7M5V020_9CNID|eukprot:TCONS_00050382-protein
MAMNNLYGSTMSLDCGGNLKSSFNQSTLSLISVNTTTSSISTKVHDFNTKDFVFCLTNKSLMQNKDLMAAIQYFKPEYTLVDTDENLEVMSNERRKYFFVCQNFDDERFKTLRRKKCRICGPPLLVYLHSRKRALPDTSRPLFNGSMFGVAVCFTGFASKGNMVNQLADLVHFMGGSVRRDFSGKITHLVANLAQGQKYKNAVNLGKHIMTDGWVLEAWEKRHTSSFKASESSFVNSFNMKPFHGLKISFLGFSPDETEHMQDITLQNDGHFVPVGEDGCTHLVIEESYSLDLTTESVKATFVVKQEWFWASIQLDVCAEENMYSYIDDKGTPLGTGSQRRFKRKHCNMSGLSDLLSPGSPFFISNKRQSRDGALSSLSSATFDSSMGSPLAMIDSPIVKETKKEISARQQKCLELQHTERNYVTILQTIIKVFKEPLEQSANQRGGALLASEEIKTIFGAIPDLLDVHEKLFASINHLVDNWHEEQLIGKAITDCAEGMMKAYPGFVNYFEFIKETINRCDKERPRFHAFLKLSMTNPDCQRQTLTELLIRPVQRLPSMSLLMDDIFKHTKENNPDHAYVNDARAAVKKVLTFINEDKRKTETQVQMFEILGEIENCPPYLLSAKRSLISKVDLMEVTEGLILKCEHLTMFLFNDCIEIAKKKNRGVNSMTYKSPAIQNIQRGNVQKKSYDHMEFIEARHLKHVVDIKDDTDFKEMFGLIHLSNITQADQLSIFKMVPGTTKAEWINKVVQRLKSSKATADAENLLMGVEPWELLSDKSDTSQEKERSGSLSKVFKKAKSGITKKVVRALSQNKTPKSHNKSTLRRAMANVTPNTYPSTPGNTSGLVSPTPSEYTIMDFSVCEEK